VKSYYILQQKTKKKKKKKKRRGSPKDKFFRSAYLRKDLQIPRPLQSVVQVGSTLLELLCNHFSSLNFSFSNCMTIDGAMLRPIGVVAPAIGLKNIYFL
jgi:hypothetical protein